MQSKRQVDHQQKVAYVQSQIAGFYERKQKARVYHGSTTSTRSKTFDPQQSIDIRDLNGILLVNTTENYADVEPNVPMDRLVKETLKYGLVPAVVPELPAITVGGSVQGGAGESSSFRWGCFHEICTQYEVILADGSIIQAAADTNSDIYFGMPCSYGSIGIVTKIRVALIPAKPYVTLQYIPVESAEEAVDMIHERANQKVDFIDAIMFGLNRGVVMVGTYSDEPLKAIASTRRLSDDWFYMHAQQVSKNGQPYEESMPLTDCLFRYDKGAFWVAKNGFNMFHLPYNRLSRTVFSGLLKNRTMYTFLNAAKLSQKYLVQDVCMPIETTVKTVEYFDKTYGIYPLWLCPLKPDSNSFMSPNYLKTVLVINIGIWGKMEDNYESFQKKHVAFEDYIRKAGGRKVLYGHVYESEESFWKPYDKAKYARLREKCSSTFVFPNIYEKVHVRERYKPSVMNGFLAVITSAFKR